MSNGYNNISVDTLKIGSDTLIAKNQNANTLKRRSDTLLEGSDTFMAKKIQTLIH